MSYFEIETQLLTFRKDILPYEFAYHLILQNRNGYKKVEGAEWGVHLRTICRNKNFYFQTRHLHTPKKLLPLHIIEVFAEFPHCVVHAHIWYAHLYEISHLPVIGVGGLFARSDLVTTAARKTFKR